MDQVQYSYTNAVVNNNQNVLQHIHLKSKNIAIYQRDIKSLREELHLIANRPIECRASGTVEEIFSKVDQYFCKKELDCPSLLDDVAQLLRLFENVTNTNSFRLLMATVSSNMCRKFHTDLNYLRLLCTYLGPGTLWVPDEAINHAALQTRGNNEEIVKDLNQVQQVATGSVVILKGALYPDGEPILHRSPTIEATGEKRLLLRIDTNKLSSLF